MALLYPKKKSPFWYMKYVDSEGVTRNKSTGLRRDSAKETEEANLVRAEREVKERSRSVADAKGTGWEFALPHLKQHCGKRVRTWERYHTCWKQVSHWMTLNRIHSPTQITHKHVDDYLKWRSSQVKATSKKKVSWNAAMLDIVPWSVVMQKAVRLGIIKANPLLKHGFKKEDVENPKPEISDEEFKTILTALKKEGVQWMQDSFKIGMETGCRLRETMIPLSCIDLKNGTITFPAPKGGRKKSFTIPMPEALRPMFERMKEDGRKITLEMPFGPSRQWNLFFRRIKLEHLCFHCLRVTKVTRLRREGVPREVAMRLVNHSSELIHMLYDRHQVEDLRKWANSGSPSVDASK